MGGARERTGGGDRVQRAEARTASFASHVRASCFRPSPTRSRGTPVVALESSVLAQGLPIPANREAADRMIGAACSGRARWPRSPRWCRVSARSASTRTSSSASFGATACARCRRAISRSRWRSEPTARRRWPPSLCIASAAGADVFATGRHRRGPSRRAVRRVGGPARARADADGRRVRRRKVHPRPRRHPRAAGDARRHRGRLSHRRAARLLHPHDRAPASGTSGQRRARSRTSSWPLAIAGPDVRRRSSSSRRPAAVALDAELVDSCGDQGAR